MSHYFNHSLRTPRGDHEALYPPGSGEKARPQPRACAKMYEIVDLASGDVLETVQKPADALHAVSRWEAKGFLCTSRSPSPAEAISNYDRVKWAEGLILQLPPTHEGRNSWLLNYGTSEEAREIRRRFKEKLER